MNTSIDRFLYMPTSIRLSAKDEQRLAFLAEQTGRTKAFYLRQLIENGLDDLEDYYLAADVLERVRRGQEKIHSSSQVRSDLGLRD
jgi:RHH-type transcriptional regulator, rel operon repressor / antitoxin RelB